MRFKAILSVLLLCTSCFTFADITNTQQQQEQIKQLSDQNIRLQEQNLMLKSSSENTNNIIFSALGFAGTFLIAFLGVNVYFLKNRADEDKKTFEKMIIDKSNENLSTLSEIIKKTIERKHRPFRQRTFIKNSHNLS